MGYAGTMVPKPPGELDEIDDRQARLDRMRAEFRAAQQRRYDTTRMALAKKAAVVKPESSPQAEPPTLATPSR